MISAASTFSNASMISVPWQSVSAPFPS
jgi:hypothetical protein